MKKALASILLSYLRICARIQLFKFRPVIVGVGGASGKTSLSHFIGLILDKKHKVLETKGKNSETGIPLSILGIKVENYTYAEWFAAFFLAPLRILFDWNKFDVLVSEMGIDGPFEPKNMAYLLKILKPKIGLLTNISFEHSEFFESLTKDKEKILELTANQESLLLKSLPKRGLAILNIDDPKIRRISQIKASRVTVSAKEMVSDYFIEKIDVDIKSFRVRFTHEKNKYQIKVNTPLPDHYAYSFLMAIAVGFRFGIEVSESIEILEENFSLPPGRMTIFKGKKETTIIDSSYNNATLSPIIDALDLLKRIGRERRRVTIIGDMRELGGIAPSYHEKVANKIVEASDVAVLIGPLMSKYVAPVLRKNNKKFYGFQTFSEAKEQINKLIDKNDLILVKGSQNTLFLERVVEMLLKNPRDKKRLCRRGKFWDKIRSQTP